LCARGYDCRTGLQLPNRLAWPSLVPLPGRKLVQAIIFSSMWTSIRRLVPMEHRPQVALRPAGSTRGTRARHPTVYQCSSLLSQNVEPSDDVPPLLRVRNGGEHLRPMHNILCRLLQRSSTALTMPPAVTRRTCHGCQTSRPATGISRGLNTSLSLSTLTASGCHGLASLTSHHSPRSQKGDLGRGSTTTQKPFLTRIGIGVASAYRIRRKEGRRPPACPRVLLDRLCDVPRQEKGCDGVEEPQGGDCDDDRTGCETPVVGQVEQVGANLG
jgi:hypothetical protein